MHWHKVNFGLKFVCQFFPTFLLGMFVRIGPSIVKLYCDLLKDKSFSHKPILHWKFFSAKLCFINDIEWAVFNFSNLVLGPS